MLVTGEGNYAAIIIYCNITVEINYLKVFKRPEGIRLQHNKVEQDEAKDISASNHYQFCLGCWVEVSKDNPTNNRTIYCAAQSADHTA